VRPAFHSGMVDSAARERVHMHLFRAHHCSLCMYTRRVSKRADVRHFRLVISDRQRRADDDDDKLVSLNMSIIK
jgi:hypothetical protein